MPGRLVIVEHARPLHAEHVNDVANAPLSASLHAGYAAAVATAAGWEVAHLDLAGGAGAAEEVRRAAGRGDTRVLLHWVYNWDAAREVKDLLAGIKAAVPGAATVAMGLFPTLLGERLLADTPALDAVLAGEFEDTLRDWLCGAPERTPPGLLRRGAGLVPRPLLDPAGLPPPRDLGRTASLDQLNVAASRGCRGGCAFCLIHPFYGASRWRPRPVKAVLAEVAARAGSGGRRSVYFVDPDFLGGPAADPARPLVIAQGLAGLGLRFGFETRVDAVRDDLLGALAGLGLESVFLGVESASPAVLRRMRKGVTPAQSGRAIATLRRHGVRVEAGFIMFEARSCLEDLATNYAFLEDQGLLEDPDQTVNMLGHGQVAFPDTAAGRELAAEGCLEPAAGGAYHGRIRHADPGVGAVAAHMDALCRAYFLEARPGLAAADMPAANAALKRAFRDLLAAARTGDLDALPAILAAGRAGLRPPA